MRNESETQDWERSHEVVINSPKRPRINLPVLRQRLAQKRRELELRKVQGFHIHKDQDCLEREIALLELRIANGGVPV